MSNGRFIYPGYAAAPQASHCMNPCSLGSTVIAPYPAQLRTVVGGSVTAALARTLALAADWLANQEGKGSKVSRHVKKAS